MKIALALEGLLIPDMEATFKLWQSRFGAGASSYLDPICLRDETFWATLRPCEGIDLIAGEMSLNSYVEYLVLTERPQKLHLITRSWLRRHGLMIEDDNIVYGSVKHLKRYDCRLHNVDYFFDSDPDVLAGFVYDWTVPVGVGKNFKPWIQAHKDVYSALLNYELDRRTDYLWDNH